MVNLQDYGIRLISHGEWNDPEIEWEKSKYQHVLFNYWDVAESTDYETLDHTNGIDLQLLVAQLRELTPSGYRLPQIYYEWEICTEELRLYGDDEYFAEYGLSLKEDFVLHNTSQALHQALSYLNDKGCKSADIQIFRHVGAERNLVANYSYQGSTLKDYMFYKK